MKYSLWLLILTSACTGTSVINAPAPSSAAYCPTRPQPTCPEPQCPKVSRLTCPKPVPQPVALDWHCMDLNATNGESLEYCWPTAKVCEQKRRTVKDENLGSSTSCATQPIAYCVGTTRPISVMWKAYCTRTAEACEQRRQVLNKHPPTKDDEIGICRPTRNIDPHEAMAAPSVQPQPVGTSAMRSAVPGT